MPDADSLPPERILRAGIELFAAKGYAGTSTRELAAAADVNLAMISYYFGSKVGLLQAIIDRYFERHSEVVARVVQLNGSLEDRVRLAVREFVGLFRAEPAMARIIFTEHPADAPEAVARKMEHIAAVLGSAMQDLLPLIVSNSPRPVSPMVVGPALMGGLAFHFMMRPIFEAVFDATFDDGFYERFPEQMADMFLYGVLGARPPAVTAKGTSEVDDAQGR